MGFQLLQRAIYSDYSSSVGLDTDAKYIFGTPLRPVVPMDVGTKSVMIVGAYPSARFAHIEGINDVPIADNLGPFESERWFDGLRVRSQASANELENLFLAPLALAREPCWITDLVKVFLFKPGHIQKYNQLGVIHPQGYERRRFRELAIRSVPWLAREIALAQPNLIITLGAEVAAVLRKTSVPGATSRNLKPIIGKLTLDDWSGNVVHCPHPGILMRSSPKNLWLQRHESEFIPAIKRFLAGVGDGV